MAGREIVPPRSNADCMSRHQPHDVIRVVESAGDIEPSAWDRLAGGNPLLRHTFVHGLERTGCAAPESGWVPCHLSLWHDDVLTGVMPLYLKDHSYGEYVFDWAWADAYHRHGLAYYPKLLCALPFTPVTGPRIMAASPHQRGLLLAGALAFAENSRASSLHVLFPPGEVATECERAGMMLRKGVQFHWHNAGYRTFEDFLGSLTREKRKKIRQERRRVHEQGITFRWIRGAEATEADWVFFERCYRRTYREHRSTPYLNLAFFLHLAQHMPEHLLLIEASRDGKPVAATFNIVIGNEVLYGRNWGAVAHVPLLHFECCYYQTIEYCIAHGIGRFEGGAQGEHKMARGLMPVETVSAHWVAHAEFRHAIGQYLARETRGIGEYVDELNEHSPFSTDAATSAEPS
ncbi:MAG: GNAT family N-acetyltransferase [Betaproteobacteria bacterium]|nr:GNAT family N-acetyltransferase [Betaproteobacteria bacterium]